MNLQRRWPDLLPDLLRDISGHLHHAVDFVRFHAVCKSWRYSHDAMATGTTQSFFPWLLVPNIKNHDPLRLICIFSKTSYSAPPLPTSPRWVANTDGTAVQYFGAHPSSSLHDPLAGVTTLVTPVPERRLFKSVSPQGVRYCDGTILLYSKDPMVNDDATEFWAAVMRPGDASWTIVERIVGDFQYTNVCTAYHGGKILVSVESSKWHVIMINGDLANDLIVPKPSMPTDHGDYYYKSGHVLESHGELLWVSIHIPNFQDGYGDKIFDLVQTLMLLVYEIQEVPGLDEIQWVRKDGKSLADRILFLGWPNSFAVDASQLGVDGGYAYFVHSEGRRYEWSAVFRYNLIHNKAEFVEWLPPGWRDDKCVWLLPQPTISPVHVRTM